MKSSCLYPLTGEIHVDEFFTGDTEENQRGRGNIKKRLVVIAVEKIGDGIGRAYGKAIENASAKEFYPFFSLHISKSAKIVTYEWNGYKPLKKDYPYLEQIPSKSGRIFLTYIFIS